MNFAAVLFAGGKSQRMGRDKAMLDWHGLSLLAHQGRTLRLAGASELFLSLRPDQSLALEGFKSVTDSSPGSGPGAALADAWRNTTSEVLLALAIDLPGMTPEYLQALARDALQNQRSIVPRRNDRYEPLAAAWHRSGQPDFSQAGGRSMQAICAGLADRNLLAAREVSDGESPLFDNLNTPRDYSQLRDTLKPAS